MENGFLLRKRHSKKESAMDHKTAMLHIAIKLGAAFGLLVVAGFILEDLNTMLPAAGQ
jgi:hypothetical protein